MNPLDPNTPEMLELMDSSTNKLSQVLMSTGPFTALTSFLLTITPTVINIAALTTAFKTINDASSTSNIYSQCYADMAKGYSSLVDSPPIALTSISTGTPFSILVPKIFTSLATFPGGTCTISNTNIQYSVINHPTDVGSTINVNPSAAALTTQPSLDLTLQTFSITNFWVKAVSSSTGQVRYQQYIFASSPPVFPNVPPSTLLATF